MSHIVSFQTNRIYLVLLGFTLFSVMALVFPTSSIPNFAFGGKYDSSGSSDNSNDATKDKDTSDDGGSSDNSDASDNVGSTNNDCGKNCNDNNDSSDNNGNNNDANTDGNLGGGGENQISECSFDKPASNMTNGTDGWKYD